MINNDWDYLLKAEFKQEYFINLKNKVIEDYQNHLCYPKINHVFNAFRLCSFKDCKVLILGQDPYHQPNQAMGLAFSVNQGVKHPPSLKNIFLELKSDLLLKYPISGDLSPWARQGVLLLNAILSVRANQPMSHKGFGWERFTDKIIEMLNQKNTQVIFVLWGKAAINKSFLITNPVHKIITAPHPSPLSAHRGFIGSKPFSRINTFLTEANLSPIDFTL